MSLKSTALAGIAVALFASPALAHHSFAMFDADTKVTIEGIVKEFQWTNPHAWIMLNVANAALAQAADRATAVRGTAMADLVVRLVLLATAVVVVADVVRVLLVAVMRADVCCSSDMKDISSAASLFVSMPATDKRRSNRSIRLEVASEASNNELLATLG